MKKSIITMVAAGAIACMMFAGCGTYTSTSTESHTVKNADGTTTTTTTTTTNDNGTVTTSSSTDTSNATSLASKAAGDEKEDIHQFQLAIENNSDAEITELYIAKSDSEDWGDNCFANIEDGVLRPGESLNEKPFTYDKNDATFDVAIVTANSNGEKIVLDSMDLSKYSDEYKDQPAVLSFDGTDGDYNWHVSLADTEAE